MFKKLLRSVSVVLTLALVFSIVTCAPFSVSAAETNELAATGTDPETVIGSFGEPSGGMYTLVNATYRLTDDVVLKGYIRIQPGVTAVIDLNGHTIDRGLSASANCAYFIVNKGTLTIKDSGDGGKLTGGYYNKGGVVNNTGTLTIEGGTFVENRAREEAGVVFNDENATLTVSGGTFKNNTTETYGGGAFVNKGTMTLSDGTITGNIAKMDGGGIFNADGATLTVTGGTVTGNCAGRKNSSGNLEGRAGGIYNSADGTLNMSGSPVIKDNANGNLWLRGNSIINVGALTDSAKIDVSADNMPRAVTSSMIWDGQAAINKNAFTFASGNTNATLIGGDGIYISAHVPNPVEVDSWDGLKTAISNYDGHPIVLTDDITNPSVNASDPIVIENKNITIDLMGHTINRNRTSSHNDGHVIWVKGSSNATIRDTAGGGVLTGGYATNGGGINVAESATLNLYNVTVADNTATDGGGIFVRGTLNIDGAVIKNNSSSDDGGAIHISDEASAVSIKNAVIAGNQGSGSDSQAGAIYHNNSNTTVIENSFIADNTTSAKGGGIYVRSGTVNMTGGAVFDNRTTEGGAVYVCSERSFTANGTVFSGNKATNGSGGAIYAEGTAALTDCTVTENSASKWGGGIYLPDDTDALLNLNSGRIENNSCSNNGGGVHVSGTATINVTGAPVVKNNTSGANAVVNNIRLTDNAVISVIGLTAATEIGVSAGNYNRTLATGLTSEADLAYFTLDESDGESVELTKSFDNGNMFVKRVNKISVSSWAQLQSAINNAQYETIFTLSQTLNADGASAMQIPDGKEIIIDLNGYNLNRGLTSEGSAGHVIQMKGSSVLTIRDTSSNHAGKVTGGWAEHGGGINLESSSTCTIESGNISSNHAKYGGGIWNKGTLTVSGGSISNNIASEEGGGIYGQGTTELENCTITNNTAKYGGGIYFDKKPNTQKATNVTIASNTGSTRGGGIFLQTGTVTLSGGSVSNNTSKDCGGIYVTDNTTLTASNTTISNNESTDESGGAIVNKGTVNLTSCTLDHNESKKRGGAIFSDDAELNLTDCTVTNNTTQGVGGGICLYEDETFNLIGGNISGNTGMEGGSGIWVDNDVDAFNVEGRAVVNNNVNSDMYLSSGRKINVTGALTAGAMIAVTLQNVSGTFTTGFKANNPDTDPGVYFAANKGMAVAADGNGEAMVIESDWRLLQNQIDELDDSDESSFLVLDRDWKAAKNDQTLVIPEGKTIKLNLNGHKIDARGFTGTVIRVEGTLIIRDTSAGKKGVITGGDSDGNGGGIYVASTGQLTLESGTISANKAKGNGGGIYNYGTLTVSGGRINNNTSDQDGGAIYNDGTLTVSGGEIAKNTAKNSGGAISIKSGAVTVTGGVMTGNTSTNYHGGAIYLKGAVLNLYGGTITDNRAALEGGGILYGENSTIQVKGSPVVKDNAAATGKNILIRSGNKINIADTLSQDAVLDIALKGDPAQALTEGYTRYGCVKSNFPYDGGSVELRVGDDGELHLPTITADKTVTTWEQLQAELNDSGNNGKTIAVGADLDGSGKDRLLFQGSGRNITVDLCGHTVDLKRTSKGDTKHVFEAKGGASLTIKDSLRTGVITGGWANNGGGIYVNENSTVNLQFVTVRGNKADSNGGGIYVNLGTLHMTGGSVYGNTAGDMGGGIFISDGDSEDEDYSVFTLSSADISCNTAKNDGGGIGIKAVSNEYCSISDCTVTNNVSQKSDGGGISVRFYTDWGVTSGVLHPLQISDTVIEHNACKDDGGGINIFYGKVEMNGCSVSHNSAKNGGGIFYDDYAQLTVENTVVNNNTVSGKGGGIYTKASATLKSCEINNNTSADSGGGIYNQNCYGRTKLFDTSVDNNRAENDKADGGGICIGEGSVKMEGGSVSGNYSGGDGGGVYIGAADWNEITSYKKNREHYPDFYTDIYDFLTDGTSFDGNTSYKAGGGIYQKKGVAYIKGGSASNNQPMISGGGIYIEDGAKTTIENTTFTENKTGFGGSAIYLEDDATLNLYGATITANEDGSDKAAVYADEDVHIKGKIIVKENDGGDFYFCHNEEFKLDGVLDEACDISVALEDKLGTFTNGLKKYNPNKDPNLFFSAPTDYSVRLDKKGEARLIGSDWIYLQEAIDSADNGGTVLLAKDYKADPIDETLVIPEGKKITLDLNGHTIDKNSSDEGDGQAIRVPNTSELIIKDTSSKQNGKITGGCSFNGGGIYVLGKLTLESGNISGNTASNGGGIFNAGTLTISGGNITGNVSGYGGGIFNTGTTTFESGNIKSNTAKKSGGGIYNKGSLTIKGGKITENTAVEEGGGVTVTGSSSALNAEDSPYVKGNNSPSGKNILLYAGKAVTLNGQLSDSAKLDVTARDYQNALTSGFGESGTSVSVFSYNENSNITIESRADGELYFPVQFGSDIQWVNNWTELQNAINNATSGKVIGLNSDLTPDGQKRIEVKNKTVTIELAGHTIDRGLTSKTDQGNVFKVYDNAKLTIRDTVQAGVITGGFANGDGGGFYVIGGATLTVEGGSITGNSATSDGAGIYVDDAELVMTGGAVSGNYSGDNGGGIYTTDKTVFTLSDAFISGNTSKYGGGGMNIHLKDSTSSITRCTISDNESEKSDGGGISLNAADKSLTVTDSNIDRNISADEGGAVYIDHGTLIMDKGSISGNTAVDGGGVYITGGDYFTAQNGALISKNKTTKYSGGGITCHGFLTINNATVSDNTSARFGGGIFYQNSGEEITLTNAKVKNNTAENDGGGIYIKQGTLTLSGGEVSGNTSIDGGGVFVTDDTKFNANGTTISSNTVTVEDGGGIVNKGETTLTGVTVSENEAHTGGGGIWNDGTLSLESCTIDGNEAKDGHGGGICQDDGNITLTGNTTIQNNTSSLYGCGVYVGDDADSFKIKDNPIITPNKFGADVYLYGSKKITVNGALSSTARVGVTLERGIGDFTKDFKKNNSGKQPNTFFISNDGYTVCLNGSEAALSKTVDTEQHFIPKNEQIVDHSKLNSKNWMGGISGERTINEINFVGTHDSAMKNVHWNIATSNLRKILGWVTAGGLALAVLVPNPILYYIGATATILSTIGWSIFGSFGASMAQTQTRYINEQMEDGVRSFDLRLNNRYCKHWFSPTLTDDGKNLYLCHGKDANGGTFYAMDKDDDFLTFNQVLDWAEEFLHDHPTETIIISLGAETLDNDKYEPIVMQRAKKILTTYSQHINPSTGKPYIYWEDGNMEKQFTHYPKLKEVRGQILINSTNDYFGGFDWSMKDTIDYRAPSTYLVSKPEQRIKDVYSFFGTNGTPDLLTNADTHSNLFYKVKMNTTDDPGRLLYMDNPREMQDEIFKEFFGEGKFFDQRGKYVGLINTDNINERVSRYVWESNFFDGLEYRTVTVKSGLDNTDLYPDKTYKLLKGTEITIPYSIYDSQNGESYFQNWRANGTDYFYGDTYKVNDDVTFEGVWGPEIKTPLTIEWNDGDDVDGLRADQLKINVTDNESNTVQEVIVDKENDWKTVITGKADSIAPDWDKITITESNPQGEHVVGYRYEVEGSEGLGYTVTLYHAATKTVNVGGTVTWDDEDNKYVRRPESVTLHLYRNGLDTGETRTASDSNGWQYSFGNLKVFQNFERTEFTVIEDPINGYSINSGDYNFTNTFDKSLFTTINGIIYWRDSFDSYGERPDTVTLHLYANGVEIDSQTVTSGDGDFTLWDFDVISYELEHPGEDTVYTVSEEPIPGYEITVKAETDEDQDVSTARIFSITNKFDSTDKLFKGHSLTLTGDVGVNFFVKLTPEQAANAKISFSWFDKELNDVPVVYDDVQKLYKASCPVAVAEMTYDVTATLTVNGEEVETNKYSVFKYANTILSDTEFIQRFKEEKGEVKYNQLADLVKAMLDYGAKAQLAFDRNTGNLANLGYDFFTEEVTPDMIESQSDLMDRDLEKYGLEYAGTTIVYLSKTSMRHYYRITDEDLFNEVTDSIYFNGQKVSYTEKNGQIYFELKNIAARNISSPYIIKISENEYQYSVLDYVRACLESSKVSETTKELVAATYRYNRMAKAYFD